MIVGCSVGAIAFAVGSDALGLDAGFRFTGVYLLAGIPIGILVIGSTAPGILFLPIEAFRAATARGDGVPAADSCVRRVSPVPQDAVGDLPRPTGVQWAHGAQACRPTADGDPHEA